MTVVEFHSLTCGNCARFHTEILPRIMREFVEPGLVRIVYRDFPLDRIAPDAAALAHCAGPERTASSWPGRPPRRPPGCAGWPRRPKAAGRRSHAGP